VDRELLKQASRIVVKLGTGILTDDRNHPDVAQIEQIVLQITALRKKGKEVVVVTSGAVGAGMGVLKLGKKPSQLARMQACAAIGQSRLMTVYERLFSKNGLHVGQVLLSHEDLEDQDRHLKARNTLLALLDHGIIPIINENDAVSVTELKFGDNDRLSALVACLLPADLLILLTSVEGLIQNFDQPNSHRIAEVARIDRQILEIAKKTSSPTAVGGMGSKIDAAKIAMRSGIPMVIASGRRKRTLSDIIRAKDIGTLFIPNAKKLAGKKRWIAFFHHPFGSLLVDDGAQEILRQGGKSLLHPGIMECRGDFNSGDVVRICDEDGTEFARGISRKSSSEIRNREKTLKVIVHCNHMVIL